MASTALTKVDPAAFQITPISEEVAQVIHEELDGLGPIPFDTVKVPSGGGIAFEVPSDDPESPDSEKSLVGVIVYHHCTNAYWANSFDGKNEQPDCASMDGKNGIDRDSGELRQCESCPLNQFGSAPDGKGKACKNMHRIYLLREGEVLPLLLPMPPTSLKAFKDYLAKRIVLKGKRAWQVLTQITLKKEQNSGGITYASCVFTKLGDLTPAQTEQIKGTVDAVKQLAESVPLTAADEASGETPPRKQFWTRCRMIRTTPSKQYTPEQIPPTAGAGQPCPGFTFLRARKRKSGTEDQHRRLSRLQNLIHRRR